MAAIPIQKQPGRFARVCYYTGRQWQRQGNNLFDLNDPQHAWDMAVSYQRKYPEREMYLDVLMSENAGWKMAPLVHLRIKDYLDTGLAALPAAPTTALPAAPTMQPQLPTPALTWSQPTPASMTEAPPGMGEMGSFMFRQQGNLLTEARNKVQELQLALQMAGSEKASLKAELDDAKMELRHKEREYKADLRDAEARIRGEVESELEPPKGGMNGLVEAISNPAHPLAGILGIVAGKFLGDAGAGAAPAGPKNGNKDLQDALDGIAELIPDEEVGAKVYAALNIILKHPQGLQQLLIMAGLEPAQNLP
jgi:hypothetical protein